MDSFESESFVSHIKQLKNERIVLKIGFDSEFAFLFVEYVSVEKLLAAIMKKYKI